MHRQASVAMVCALVLLLPLTSGLGSAPVLAPGRHRIARAAGAVESPAPSTAAPDLIITDVWLQAGEICTQLRNVGDAPSPAGHLTTLSIDGHVKATDLVDVQLGAGERRNRCLNLQWFCESPQDLLVVCADAEKQISEGDEDNNCHAEVWRCDTTPPTITSGPSVSEVTQDSALVEWTTDEDADSLVRYGSRAATYSAQASSTSLSQGHQLVLNNLEPATTYHFVAESVDGSGNRVTSPEGFFQTLPVDDGLAPKIARLAAVGRRLPPEFAATVEETTPADRVVFTMDGTHLATDYSPPFQVPADAILLGIHVNNFYAPHSINAYAYDLDGEEMAASAAWDGSYLLTCPSTQPSLEFRLPADGHRLYTEGAAMPPGMELLEVKSKELMGLEWSRIPGAIPGMSDRTHGDWHVVEPVAFTLDGVALPTIPLGHPYGQELVLQYSFDPGGMSLGTHLLAAEAVSSHGCVVRDSVEIEVVGPPEVTLGRTVTRHGSYLAVELLVSNAGSGPATVIRVSDTMAGLQATMPSVLGEYLAEVQYFQASGQSRIDIFPSGGKRLEAGETWTLTYYAVPILFVGTHERWIGAWSQVRYSSTFGVEDETLSELVAWVEIPDSHPVPLDTAVEDAAAAADYLLVTDPQMLYAFDETAEVDGLLADMAELARWRGGVLGHFAGYHSIPTGFEAGDPLTTGAFWDGDEDEIWLADVDGDQIRAYLLDGTEVEAPFMDFPLAHDLAPGDSLALGNVWGSCSDGSEHAWAEIVVADGSAHQVRVYQSGYLPGTIEFQQWVVPAPYDAGDGLALADVADDPPGTATPEEEVIHADGDGTIRIYHHETLVTSFASGFEPGDGFAAGDVFGDGTPEEVVFADLSHGDIVAHDVEVGSFGFACGVLGLDLGPGDALAVGDVLGGSREEILIADESEDQIRVYAFSTPMTCLHLGDYAVPFEPEDSLAVGDFFWPYDGYDDVVVVRGRDLGAHRRGDAEVFSLLPGDPPGDRHSLDTLINPGGAWAEQLADGWTENGYLLLVGELEIIPTFSDREYLAWNTRRGDIDYTDAPYGNTAGSPARPELSIGRVVGYNAARLRIPIQASIAVASGEANFDSSDGYAVSGYPRAYDGTAEHWIDFREVRRTVASTLTGKGFTVEADHTPAEVEFFGDATDKDIIFLAGHGYYNTWDYISSGDVRTQLDTGGCHPLVVTEACLTGRYPAGYSLAEAFLASGAAAYIGATEVTITPWSRRLAEHVFYKLDATHATAGLALRDAKIDRFDDGSVAWDPNYLRYTNKVVQFYGDPKLEITWLAAAGAPVASTSLSTGDVQMTAGTLASIPVQVPDYEVTTISDTHHVEIPGGDLLLVPFQPQVPSYEVHLDYPPGTEIQDVALVDKGEAVWDTGLKLPLAVPRVNGLPGEAAQAQPDGPQPWPGQEFTWSTAQGSGGDLELNLSLFPFQYYSETTNAAFTSDWLFAVEAASSPVRIHSFWLDRFTYAPGQPLEAHVYLFSTTPQLLDLIVEARVRSEARSEIVAGLPLRTLHDVKGLASFSVVWQDTGNFEPGPYSLEILIRDGDGVLLDQDSRLLDLGVVAANLTGLAATPVAFDPGEQVAVSFDIKNTGTEVLSGTATLRLQDEGGAVLWEHRHNLGPAVPGQSVSINEEWDSSGAAPGTYRFVATAAYDGRVAGPAIIELQCGRRLYLPLLLRVGSE